MDIFKPKYKHSSEYIRAEAVSQLDNVNLLTRIYHNDTARPVREVALKKITGEKDMKDVINKLSEQSMLADIAINAYGIEDDKIAFNKLTDQAQISRVCLNTDYHTEEAINNKKLTDTKTLITIIKNTHCNTFTPIKAYWLNSSVTKAAMKMITNQTDLEDILTSFHSNEEALLAAIEKITNTNVLTNLINKEYKTHANPCVIEAAHERLSTLSKPTGTTKLSRSHDKIISCSMCKKNTYSWSSHVIL